MTPSPPEGLVHLRHESPRGTALLVRAPRRVGLLLALVTALGLSIGLGERLGAPIAVLALAGLVVGAVRGWASAREVVIGRGEIVGEGGAVPLAAVERCEEVEGLLEVEVRLLTEGGGVVTVFTGDRAHAAWIAQLVRRALREGEVPVPPPPARLLPR